MVVENVHVFQPHPFQALVKAGKHILPAAPFAVGTRPHVIARFGADDDLVPVNAQVVFQNLAEIPLGAAVRGAIVVGEVKVSNAVVESGAAHVPHGFVAAGIAEVVPQAKGHGRQLQAALARAVVGHGIISGFRSDVHDENLLFLYYTALREECQRKGKRAVPSLKGRHRKQRNTR